MYKMASINAAITVGKGIMQGIVVIRVHHRAPRFVTTIIRLAT